MKNCWRPTLNLLILLNGLLLNTASHADNLGRLFFTPAERLAIDQGVPMPAADSAFRLDGSLQASHVENGATPKVIYWINGQPGTLPNTRTSPGLAVGDSSNSPLLPSGSIRIHRREAAQ